MKSFSQFWEDAASDYKKGKEAYERTQRGKKEAGQRSSSADEYTRTQKEKTFAKSADAEQGTQEVEATTKKLASQRIQHDQEAAQKAAQTARATKKVVKGVIGAVKSVVKRK
jgi:hypothetical protein